MKTNCQNTIDAEILVNIAKGDAEAFGRFANIIYKKLFPFTASLIRSKADADDILQEVFVKIWTHRSALPAIANPVGWVCTIIANTVSNHLKSRIRRELSIQKLNSHQVVTRESIEDTLDAKFTQSLIDEAVSRLPEKRKLVFLLSKKEGLSRKEIAGRLNISENTVRNQLAEAIHSLHNHLGRMNDIILPLLFVAQYFPELFF